MMIFFLLGLLSTSSKLPEIAWPAFLIALFLTFVARPLGTFALHLPNGHLVVLILRQGEVIIPKGDTVLEVGDVMVMNGKN